MNDNNHPKLEVWSRTLDLVVAIYAATKGFPKEELYSLTNQIRRAAVSVPSNIAEGRSKRNTKAFMHFINIASGSASELDTQIRIAERLHYLGSNDANKIIEEIAIIGRMLNKLYVRLETKLASSSSQPLTSNLQPQ